MATAILAPSQQCEPKLPLALQQASDTAMSVRNVREVVALGSSTPKLAALIAEAGEQPTQGVIMAYLARMVDNMHLPNGLTPDNIRDIAEYLVTEPEVVTWLTLPDMRMLCRRIEDGAYMRFNNRFGKDDFYFCLGRYCGERRSAHEEVARKEQEQYKEKVVADGEVAEAVGIIRDALRHVVPAEPKACNDGDDIQRKVVNTARMLMQTRGLGWCEAIDMAADMIENQ